MKNRFLDSFGFIDPLQTIHISRQENFNRRLKMGEENKKEWKQVEDQIFTFDDDKNKEITGVLISKEPGRSYDNEVYKLKDNDSKTHVVFGTVVLQSMMANANIGDEVRIVYTGEKENPKKGQNPTKQFDVFIR